MRKQEGSAGNMADTRALLNRLTCRICREPIEHIDKFVRYGHRHNAHWNCKLENLKTQAKQEVFLLGLRSDQLRAIPWGIVQRFKWMPHFLHLILDARDRQPSGGSI